LVGESLADAKRLLESKNLRLGQVSYQPSSELLPNTVLDQYPSSGGRLDEQDQVDVVVSEMGEAGTDEATTDEPIDDADANAPEEEDDEGGAR
jgi:beta-lactam-binding protein with PASTA domain